MVGEHGSDRFQEGLCDEQLPRFERPSGWRLSDTHERCGGEQVIFGMSVGVVVGGYPGKIGTVELATCRSRETGCRLYVEWYFGQWQIMMKPGVYARCWHVAQKCATF